MKSAASRGSIGSGFLESSRGKTFCGLGFLLILAAVCLPVSGCSKKSQSEIKTAAPADASRNVPAPQTQYATASSNSAPSPASPRPFPASSQTIPANATPEAVTAQLTIELRRYIAFTRSFPKDFEDFTAHNPIKFPPPPAGKKYVIIGGKVIIQ